jgi:mRNA interferase MazF
MLRLPTATVFPFQTLLPAATTGLRQDSKAQAERVRSIAVERLGAVLGQVPAEVMAHLDDALRLHLHLWARPRRSGGARSQTSPLASAP